LKPLFESVQASNNAIGTSETGQQLGATAMPYGIDLSLKSRLNCCSSKAVVANFSKQQLSLLALVERIGREVNTSMEVSGRLTAPECNISVQS